MKVTVIPISKKEELIFHTKFFGLIEVCYSSIELPAVARCYFNKYVISKKYGFFKL